MKAYLKTLDTDLSPFESQRKYREALARFLVWMQQNMQNPT